MRKSPCFMPLFNRNAIKSALNWVNHGITLAEAENLWKDKFRWFFAVIPTNSESDYGIIAKWDGQIWYALYRLTGEGIQIVFCRRAKPREIATYYARRI